MTDDKLEELEIKARAATPGPWHTERTAINEKVWVMSTADKLAVCKAGFTRAEAIDAANAAFIAAANPATVLELITQLRQERAILYWITEFPAI